MYTQSAFLAKLYIAWACFLKCVQRRQLADRHQSKGTLKAHHMSLRAKVCYMILKAHTELIYLICISERIYMYRYNLSRIVRKPDFCLGENKGADQLRGNREADQRLCFRYSDSTIPLLLKSEISSF